MGSNCVAEPKTPDFRIREASCDEMLPERTPAAEASDISAQAHAGPYQGEKEGRAPDMPEIGDEGELRRDPRARILALYDEFRPRLFRYMGSMRLGRECADEVIQETFMRLTTALLKADEIENMQGWIVRVAHNLAVDMLKREHGPVIDSDGVAFAIENLVDPALTPEEAYSRKEQAGRVKLALSTLKPQHRECFQMRVRGLRYKDIGVALGISEQRAAFVVKQAAVRLAALCG